MSCLPVYLLLRPLLAGRRVLDAGWPIDSSTDVLGRADAALIETWRPELPSELGYGWEELVTSQAGRFDFVLGLDLLERLSHEQRTRCLRGVKALLSPGGVAVLAVPNRRVALLDDGGVNLGDHPPALDFWSFSALLVEHFPKLAFFGQRPMRGCYISALQPAVEPDVLALIDEQASEPEECSHFIAISSLTELPAVQRYALVTLPYHPLVQAVGRREPQGLTERLRVVENDRDLAREALLALEERAERRETDLSAAQASAAELRQQLRLLQSELDANKARLTEVIAQRQLAEAAPELQQLEQRLIKAERRSADLELSCQEASLRLERGASDLEHARASRDLMQAALADAEQHASRQQRDLDQAVAALEASQARLRESEQMLNALRLERQERQRLVDCLEATVHERDRVLEQAGQRREAAELALRELGVKATALRSELEASRARVGQGLIRIAELEGELDELRDSQR